MTHAITLIKSETGKMDDTLKYLCKLKEIESPFGNNVSIDECFISFGWPDFVLLLSGENVEILKDAIVKMRSLVLTNCDANLETSTIICTSASELNEGNKNLKNTKN